jgi:hypothetical protein
LSAPFLTYLTVFKSRLGVINLVLPITGFAYQPSITLSRKLKAVLERRVELRVDDHHNDIIFQYLIDKNLISSNIRSSGRYQSVRLEKFGEGWLAQDNRGTPIEKLTVFQTDIWMSHPSILSTIGLPTPDNNNEILELSFQLAVVSKAKNTWTAIGQLLSNLRAYLPGAISEPDNPFLLGLESPVFLRQILEKDGLITREMLREMREIPYELTRDNLMHRLAAATKRALQEAQRIKLPPPILAEGKSFLKLIEETTTKRNASLKSKGKTSSVGPGVLEHRTAPRLEWLTDLGFLSKEGLPKNSFQYRWLPSAGRLLEELDNHINDAYWPDSVALQEWRLSEYWAPMRQLLPEIDFRSALRSGYRVMKRVVGPAAIRDVCFAAGILAPHLHLTFTQIIDELVRWSNEEKGITLSGGRYKRGPELVHMNQAFLGE